MRQVVAFELGAEEFAVDVAQVDEIVRLLPVTRLPHAPRYVEGVINLRGRILPVIDLARRFGLPEHERTRRSRIVIVAVEGRTVGMLVDAVTEVLRLPDDAVEPAPAVLRDGPHADCLTGIGRLDERLLVMLDLPRVLTHQELAEVAP